MPEHSQPKIFATPIDNESGRTVFVRAGSDEQSDRHIIEDGLMVALGLDHKPRVTLTGNDVGGVPQLRIAYVGLSPERPPNRIVLNAGSSKTSYVVRPPV